MTLAARRTASIVLPIGLAASAFGSQAASTQEAVPALWWITPVAALLGLVAAFMFSRQVLARDAGNERMQEIAGYVRDGAYAYLGQQYRVVAIFMVVVAALLWLMSLNGVQHPLVPIAFITGGLLSGLAGFFGMDMATNASSRTAQASMQSLNQGLQVAFRSGAVMGLTVVGLALFGIAGWFVYLTQFHHVVTGGNPLSLDQVTVIMLGSALGASSMALFARVGGGIFTKAADVGADLVGKVEAGIPEDDPRNPAAIADNVGDNVGDVAGMGADLFESYLGSILATCVLGVAAVSALPAALAENYPGAMTFVVAPMLVSAIGIILSIVGIFFVRLNNAQATEKDLLPTLDNAILISNGMVLVAVFGLMQFLLDMPMGIFGSVVVGMVVGILIGKGTAYYTAAEHSPTQSIARQAESGTGPAIIGGVAEGMLSVWIPNTVVAIGTVLAFGFAGGFGEAGLMMGLYGVGIAAVGMLATLGITLATDAYGPIADNAGGNAEMSGLPPEVRERTDALDSLGNTTAAIGKGFAIGSAALTALALLASYIEQVRISIHREATVAYVAPSEGQQYAIADLGHGKWGVYFASGNENDTQEDLTLSAFEGSADGGIYLNVPGEEAGSEQLLHLAVNDYGSAAGRIIDELQVMDMTSDAPRLLTADVASVRDFMLFYGVELMNPSVLAGVFFGVMLVFVFSAMTMKAVSNAAASMVQEVRRQFREIPGIMENKQKPDYARCVSISTKQAQAEMVLPTMLALLVPVIVGIVFSVAGVMGLLLGGLASGFALAIFMANSGGAWDNAKKYIEAGNHGGKNSEAHKAAVVGDTVGDPFKDTSGPSLNILIKLMNVVSIVFAGLVVKYAPMVGDSIRQLAVSLGFN